MPTTIKLDQLDIFGFLDPAGRRKQGEALKKVRARSAIVIIGADYLRRIFVLDTWAKKASAIETMEKVFELNEKWKMRVFGCEANAMQELYAEMLALEATRREVRLPLVPIPQTTKVEKEFRIRTTLNPVVGFGRLFLHESQHDLHREITAFPMMVQKDLVDALASAVALVPPKSPPAAQRTEREALAKYLRDQGTPPSLIQARLDEFDGVASNIASLGRPLYTPRG